MTTVGEAVAATLVANGVTDIFGIPGIHTLAIYDGLAGEASRMRHHVTRHEQGAAFAADGFARVSARPGVCLATTGPGVFNTVTAVAEAWADSSAVLLLAGQVKIDEIGRRKGVLHETPDQAATFRAITVSAATPRTPGDVPYAVARAFVDMATGRPRPAYVEMPNDIMGEHLVGFAPIVHPRPTPPSPDPDAVTAAARMLAAARRPLIIAGAGLVASRAQDELRGLAERLGAPVLPTGPTVGALPDDHPLAGDMIAGYHAAHLRLFEEADVVFAAGAHLGFQSTSYWKVPLHRLVHLNIEADVIGRSYPAEVGLVGDARLGLAALLDELGAGSPSVDHDWGEAAAGRARRELRESIAPERRAVDAAMRAAREQLPRESIVTHDAALFNFWSAYSWPVYRVAGSLWPWGSATLGFALGSAVGASIAVDRQVPVVAACGDGGFLFTATELATAVREQLPLIVLVHNDHGFNSIGSIQKRDYGREYGAALTNPDLVTFARSFGADARRVERIADLPDAVARARDSGGPALIEITVDVGRPW